MTTRVVDGNTLVVMSDAGESLYRMEERIEVARAVVGISGVVGEETAHHFADELEALSTVCNSITIDFSGASGISGKALQALVKTRVDLDERPGAQLVLVGLPAEIRAELSGSGLIDFFQIQD